MLGHQAAVPLLVVELRRVAQERPQIGVAAMLRDLGQVRRVVGALAEQRVAVDAVLPVPDVLAGDDLRRDRSRRCVSLPNCRWLSMVSPTKTAAKTLVPTMKNSRVCRLVMQTSARNRRPQAGGRGRSTREPDRNAVDVVSDADPREVEDRDPGSEGDGHRHPEEDHGAKCACQSRGPRDTNSVRHRYSSSRACGSPTIGA